MTWRVNCSVPKGGVAPGGSLLVMFPPAYYVTRPANLLPQVADPKAPGYAKASVDGKTAGLTVMATPSYPVILKLKSGKRGWKDGKKIEIVLGETDDGRPTFRAPNSSTPSFSLIVLVDPKGTGHYIRIPVLDEIAVAPGPARVGEIIAPSVVRRTEEFQVTVRFRDQFGNIAKPSASAVINLQDENCSAPKGDDPACRGYLAPAAQTTAAGWAKIKGGSFTLAGYHYLSADFGGAFPAALSNPIYVTDEANPRRIYFGDPHGHTSYSDGLGSPEDYFETAAGPAALAFAAVTDDERQLDEEKWQRLQRLCEERRASGEFVSLLGWEHPAGGRGIVLYDNCRASLGLPISGSLDLWDVEINGARSQASSELPPPSDRGTAFIPIAPAAFTGDVDKDSFSVGKAVSAEIYSSRGSSESEGAPRPVSPFNEKGSISAALAREYRFGFIASSDSRDGKPGLSAAGPFPGGLTAVETGALTRRTIFDSIANGRSYATTGARIILRADVDGRPPGRPYMPTDSPVLHFEIAGTAPIGLVEIIKDGDVAWAQSQDTPTRITAGQWKDDAFERSSFYYLRVTQSDGETAWSSPFFLERTAVPSSPEKTP